MACEDVTNALAALLLASFLLNVLLATALRLTDDYDDPIGESLLLRDTELSVISLADSDEDDVFNSRNGVLADPYAVLPPGYGVEHVRHGGGAVESVLPAADVPRADADWAMPGSSDV